jgi:hypothetical protein
MNQYEFVLGIIIVVMIASIFKARYKYSVRQDRGESRPTNPARLNARSISSGIADMAGLAFPFVLLLTLAITLVSAAGLRAWRQWLEVKRVEIAGRGPVGSRTELGDLRRRVRRLEALANGIDL